MTLRIHFVFPAARPGWPMVQLLRQRFPEASFDCGEASGIGRYQRTLQLAARTPWLVWYAFRSVYSRLQKEPPPDYVVVETDAEVVGSIFARFLKGKRVPIVFQGFIYTPRRSRLMRAVRQLYYKILLSRTQAVICYSKIEAQNLPKIF